MTLYCIFSLTLIALCSPFFSGCSAAFSIEEKSRFDIIGLSDHHLRYRRQFANLPNGAACLGNLDCASGCCLVQYEYAGVCVVRALPGQICGLLSYAALAPPGFYTHDRDFDNWRRRRRATGSGKKRRTRTLASRSANMLQK